MSYDNDYLFCENMYKESEKSPFHFYNLNEMLSHRVSLESISLFSDAHILKV